MKGNSVLVRAFAPVVHRMLLRLRNWPRPIPSFLRRDLELQLLEPRRLLSGLGYHVFGSTTPGTAAGASGTVSDINQTYSTNPVTSDSTPFEVVYSGTLTLSSDQAGTYFFELPAAEGAVLKIDGETVIYAPSIPGDANLDGNVDTTDLDIVFSHYLDTGTWADGEFHGGDGTVDISDEDTVFSNFFSTATPVVIDNAGDDNPYGLSTAGVSLSAGAHDFQLDYFQFNDDENSSSQTPVAQLLYSTSATGTYSDLTDLSLAPYPSPTDLIASYEGSNYELNWSSVTGASSYNVYESSSPDFYAVSANLLGTTSSTDYSVTAPSSGTSKYFLVTAVNSLGEESPASNEVSLNDDSQSYLTDMQVQVDGTGNDLITGTFSGSTEDRTIHVDNSAGTEIATISGSDLPWKGTGISSGDDITAWLSDSEGDAWNPVTTTAAAATGSISGTVYNDANINGTQDTGEAGLSGVTVFIDLNNDGTLDSGDPTTTTDSSGNYSFSGLFTGVDLKVEVQPPSGFLSEGTDSDGSGSSIVNLSGSDSLTGLSFGQIRTLLAPETLTATASSSSEVDLAWSDPNAGNETGFHIECSTDGGSFELIGTVEAGSTTYPATGLNTTEHDYVFRVAAYDSNGDSSYSNTADANAPQVNLTNLQALADASTNTVAITWTSDLNVNFYIYRDDSSTPYATVLASSATEESDDIHWDYSFTDTGVGAGESHTYKVVPFVVVTGSITSSGGGTGGAGSDMDVSMTSTGFVLTEVTPWDFVAQIPLEAGSGVADYPGGFTGTIPPSTLDGDYLEATYCQEDYEMSSSEFYNSVYYEQHPGVYFEGGPAEFGGYAPILDNLTLPTLPVYNISSSGGFDLPGNYKYFAIYKSASWITGGWDNYIGLDLFWSGFADLGGAESAAYVGVVDTTYFYAP